LDAVINDHSVSQFGLAAKGRRRDELFNQNASVGLDNPP
jgi:hypothetical protein